MKITLLKLVPINTNWGTAFWAVNDAGVLYLGMHVVGTSKWKYTPYDIDGFTHIVKNDMVVRSDGYSVPLNEWDGIDGTSPYGREILRMEKQIEI